MENNHYTPIYRIVHWAIALCMLALCITIFLRLGWMNKAHMATIIETNATNISSNEATIIARKIRQPMWIWHIYLGYTLVGLFSIRFLLPLFGKMKFQNPLQKNLSAKERFQFGVYLLFYICIVCSLITGLFLEFGSEELEHTMEDLHVLSIYYLVTYIVLHMGGVLLAELTHNQGIISRIISGRKKN